MDGSSMPHRSSSLSFPLAAVKGATLDNFAELQPDRWYSAAEGSQQAQVCGKSAETSKKERKAAEGLQGTV